MSMSAAAAWTTGWEDSGPLTAGNGSRLADATEAGRDGVRACGCSLMQRVLETRKFIRHSEWVITEPGPPIFRDSCPGDEALG